MNKEEETNDDTRLENLFEPGALLTYMYNLASLEAPVRTDSGSTGTVRVCTNSGVTKV